ncbi:MAG: 4Fe-4S binding protein [Bacteroidales bacterium]|nr:4Fe-4S binding protein [Bacteroidales bacterium]
MRNTRLLRLPLAVFFTILLLLIPVQLKIENPMLLLERFLPGGGWFEIAAIALYGAIVAYHMQDPSKVQIWRRYTWLAFSLIFFSQLILGLFGFERFLMTGKLHLPIPMMILGGPLYRGHLSVMSILFVSTLVLSGPAWCSHLCYFGAIDSVGAKGRTRRSPIRYKWALKSTVLLLVIAAALLLRWMKVPVLSATLLALGFGVIGLGIILLVSRKEGRMVHCTAYCPIGTIVNLTRFVNPFRLSIDRESCTDCMACTSKCKYDALNPEDIAARKPGLTCTLCGDCLSSCHSGSLHYRFPGLSTRAARNLYLAITISLHAATMALARI